MPAHHVGRESRSTRRSAHGIEPDERSDPTTHDPRPIDVPADRYRIRVGGHLDARWTGRLDALSMTRQPDGATDIEVQAIDQAALHGLLGRIRDAGLRLISVIPIDPDRPTQGDPR